MSLLCLKEKIEALKGLVLVECAFKEVQLFISDEIIRFGVISSFLVSIFWGGPGGPKIKNNNFPR